MEENTIIAQGACGWSTEYILYEDGHRNISGTGKIDDYTFYVRNILSDKAITSVEMTDTITEIGAFPLVTVTHWQILIFLLD